MLKNISVMGGFRSIAILYLIFGLTWQFSYFAIINNPSHITDILDSFYFIFVAGSVFANYVLIFMAGFLQTLHWFNREELATF